MRTGDLAAIPVDLEALDGEPLRDTPLPLTVDVDRPDEINLVAHLAPRQVPSAGIAGVDELQCWEHVALGKRLLDGEQLLHIMGRSHSGVHLGDEMRRLRITTLESDALCTQPSGGHA